MSKFWAYLRNSRSGMSYKLRGYAIPLGYSVAASTIKKRQLKKCARQTGAASRSGSSSFHLTLQEFGAFGRWMAKHRLLGKARSSTWQICVQNVISNFLVLRLLFHILFFSGAELRNHWHRERLTIFFSIYFLLFVVVVSYFVTCIDEGS